jgi:predicted membrane protein
MNTFSSLFKKENMAEFILVIIIILYLIMGYETPEAITSILDSPLGKLSLFLIVIYMFIYTSPVLAILSLFVAFMLINNGSYMNNTSEFIQKYIPSEINKTHQFNAFNQFPYTLEQEVVHKMAPIIQTGTTLTKPPYKPNMDNLYDASPINYK